MKTLLLTTIIFFLSAISLFAQSKINFSFNDNPYEYALKPDEDDASKANFIITSDVITKYDYRWQNELDSLNVDSQKIYIKKGDVFVFEHDDNLDTLKTKAIALTDTVASYYNGNVLVYEHKELSEGFKIQKIVRIESPQENSFTSNFQVDENITEEDFRYLLTNTLNKLLPDNGKIEDLTVNSTLDKNYNDLVFRLWYYTKDYFSKKVFKENLEALENEKLEEAGVLELINSSFTLKGKKSKNDQDSIFVDFKISKLEVAIRKNQCALTVIGDIIDKLDTTEMIVEYNNWDIYLSNRNFESQTNGFDYEGYSFEYNLSDVIKYLGPKDGKATLNVKNTSFALTPKDTKQTLYKRAFTDFISGVLFTDLLSSRAQKPNKFLQTEIMVNFPLNNKNRKKFILMNEIYGAITYSQISDDVPQLDLTKGSDGIYRAEFMDFIKYNTIQTKMRLNLIRMQNKLIQGNSYLDIGFDMFSSTTRYFENIQRNSSDSTANYSSFLVSKISPQVTYRLEAFPTSKVGIMFDVSYGLFFKQRTASKDDIQYRISPTDRHEDSKKGFRDQIHEHLLTYSINALYLFNPEKGAAGGIFGRVRIFHDVHAEEIYPQILVGYGVNISSLMK